MSDDGEVGIDTFGFFFPEFNIDLLLSGIALVAHCTSPFQKKSPTPKGRALATA
jgi:hypothetical protein